MSFFSDQAAQFQQLADNIQSQIDNANPPLDAATRSTLEDRQSDLEAQQSDMVAADIKGTLGKLSIDQTRLATCTLNLNKAVQTVKDINQVVAIVTAGVTLATAIVSANPGAIVTALAGAEKAVSDALGKSKVVTMPSAASPPKGSAAGTVTSLAASSGSDDPQT